MMTVVVFSENKTSNRFIWFYCCDIGWLKLPFDFFVFNVSVISTIIMFYEILMTFMRLHSMILYQRLTSNHHEKKKPILVTQFSLWVVDVAAE